MTWWLRVLPRAVVFGVWFVGQMVRANWQVAVDVLTPGSSLTPAVIAYQTRCRSSAELTLLSDLITLTPGTLTIDVAIPQADGENNEIVTTGGEAVLYVLGLYAPADREAFRGQLADMESRMLQVVRRPAAAGDAEQLAGRHREGRQ